MNLEDFSGSHFPPSFMGDPWAYAFSVFGQLGCALLAAEWLWRIIWRLWDDPQPWRDPLSIVRVVLALLLTSTLLRITPDVVLVMSWPELDPASRATVAMIDKFLDGAAIVPFTLAWAASLFGSAVVEFQLIRHPIPGDLWPTWDRVRRPLAIGAIILIISLTLAFLR